MSGIPPTGIKGRRGPLLGSVPGLGVSNQRDGVAFYDTIVTALGGPKIQSRSDATWWGDLLLIPKKGPPTHDAIIFFSASSRPDLARVVAALKADPRFSNRKFESSMSPPLGPKPRKYWVHFPDLDGNTVWVTFTDWQ